LDEDVAFLIFLAGRLTGARQHCMRSSEYCCG
jgi:hypothetical protein